MRVKMLTTVPGSIDGVVSEYVAGKEYPLEGEDAEALGRLFVKLKYAERVPEDVMGAVGGVDNTSSVLDTVSNGTLPVKGKRSRKSV